MWRRVLAVTALSLLAPAAAAQAVIVQSQFDGGLDGWTLSGDAAPGSPVLQAAGGDPGPFAQAVDANTGAQLYWVAPARYRAGGLGLFGGTLAFDRISDHPADMASQGGDLELQGADERVLYYRELTLALEPQLQWQRTAALMLPTAHWTDRTGSPATTDEFADVLGRLQAIRIAAGYSSQAETDGLDSVLLAYTALLPAATRAIALPPARVPCRARIPLRIRFHRAAGVDYASAAVFVNRRRVRVLSGAALSAPVDIAPLPRGTSIVRVVIVTVDGRNISIHRTYRTCRS